MRIGLLLIQFCFDRVIVPGRLSGHTLHCFDSTLNNQIFYLVLLGLQSSPAFQTDMS